MSKNGILLSSSNSIVNLMLSCRLFIKFKNSLALIVFAQRSKVIYKAGCWNCDEFYIGKTKRRLHDRKTEHFKALAKSDHSSAIANHVKTTGHDIKWDHFDILASGETDVHCKIKETLFIKELKPSLNVNISSEKLLLF